MALFVATHNVFCAKTSCVISRGSDIVRQRIIAINSGSSLARRRSSNDTFDRCLDFQLLVV